MKSDTLIVEVEKIYKYKKIKLKRIKITDEFKAHPPKDEKIKLKYWLYIKTGKLSPITINKNRELVDGYCQYLLAKMFGVKKVEVEVR